MTVTSRELLIAGIVFIILAGIFHWSHAFWLLGILLVLVAVLNDRKDHHKNSQDDREVF